MKLKKINFKKKPKNTKLKEVNLLNLLEIELT